MRIFFVKVTVLISFLSLVVFSCNKEKNDQFILWVSPEGSQEANNGQILTFSIVTKSNVSITNVLIRERRNNEYMTTIADTIPNRNDFNWQFEYKVPALASEYELLDLVFEVTDANGNWLQSLRVISVYTNGKDLLSETTGHTLYSSSSTDFNAFDLVNNNLLVVPLYDTSAVIDSSHIHFADATVATDIDLSKRWISLAGNQFVRFNDLDYGNATKTTLKNAYDIGLKRDFVEGISADDIIVTRYLETDSSEYVYAAIKIVQVIDVEGTSDKDRYIFNIKK